VCDLPDGSSAPDASFHEFEGRLWLRLAGWDWQQPAGLPSFGARSFVDLLEDRIPFQGFWYTDLWKHFVRTPLCAHTTGLLNPTCVPRGQAVRLDGAKVLHDGEERSVRHLRNFVENEIVLAGDAVMVRACAPQAVPAGPNPTPDLHLEVFPRHAGTEVLGRRLDRFQDLASLRARVYHSVNHPWHTPELRKAVAAIPADLLSPDDDVRVALAKMPSFLLDSRDVANELALEVDGNLSADMARMRDRLRLWAIHGRTGAVSMDDAPEIVTDLRGFADALLQVRKQWGRRAHLDPVRLRLDYLDRVVMPRLHDLEAPGGEDLEALTGLAP